MIYWILGEGGDLGAALAAQLPTEDTHYQLAKSFNWSDFDSLQQQFNDEVRRFFQRVEDKDWVIIYAAGICTMGSSKEMVSQEIKLIQLFINTLKPYLAKHNNGTITFASSAGAIYAGHQKVHINECSSVKPNSHYGEGKLVQEEIFNSISNEFDIRVIIARISTLYGGHKSLVNGKGLISYLARCLINRQVANIFVPYDTSRDYLHVYDAAAKIYQHIKEFKGVRTTNIIAAESSRTIAQVVAAFNNVSSIKLLTVNAVNDRTSLYGDAQSFKPNTELDCHINCHFNMVTGVHNLLYFR